MRGGVGYKVGTSQSGKAMSIFLAGVQSVSILSHSPIDVHVFVYPLLHMSCFAGTPRWFPDRLDWRIPGAVWLCSARG